MYICLHSVSGFRFAFVYMRFRRVSWVGCLTSACFFGVQESSSEGFLGLGVLFRFFLGVQESIMA